MGSSRLQISWRAITLNICLLSKERKTLKHLKSLGDKLTYKWLVMATRTALSSHGDIKNHPCCMIKYPGKGTCGQHCSARMQHASFAALEEAPNNTAAAGLCEAHWNPTPPYHHSPCNTRPFVRLPYHKVARKVHTEREKMHAKNLPHPMPQKTGRFPIPAHHFWSKTGARERNPLFCFWFLLKLPILGFNSFLLLTNGIKHDTVLNVLINVIQFSTSIEGRHMP